MNEFYNKDTIDNVVKRIDEKLDDLIVHQTETHQEVRKTNGRVQKLERWRAYMTGAVAVLTALLLPVVGYMTHALGDKLFN